MVRFLFGIFLGLLLAPGIVVAYLKVGQPPIAVADKPLYDEEALTKIPLQARIQREAPGFSPIQPTAENLAAGAQIYREQCASCHGLHGKPSSFASHMYPESPALWEQTGNSAVVGVSDDPVGVTYWKVTNGIRLTGMPSYQGILTENQIWQVSLLLANADKALPPSVLDQVRGQKSAPVPQAPEDHAVAKKP